MAGHSKWKQIKHKKAATDAKRSNLFSKLSKLITAAARTGADPGSNPALRFAIDRARSFNLPSDNIERAVKKASAAKDEAALTEVLYEAYGPGGSAILIEGITDNKNRTAAEVKHILSEYGGKLAEAGSVLWLFEKRGRILLALEENTSLQNPESDLDLIDSGAEDLAREVEGIEIQTSTQSRGSVEKNLTTRGFAISESYDALIPKMPVSLKESLEATLQQLVEKLEEHEDVQNVWTNIEM